MHPLYICAKILLFINKIKATVLIKYSFGTFSLIARNSSRWSVAAMRELMTA